MAGTSEPKVVHALAVQFSADIPAADKTVNAVGGNGEHPSRFRLFSGVRDENRYYYPSYALDNPPPSKRPWVEVQGDSPPRQTAESISASAAIIEDAKASGKIMTAVRSSALNEGFKRSLLFFARARQTGLGSRR